MFSLHHLTFYGIHPGHHLLLGIPSHGCILQKGEVKLPRRKKREEAGQRQKGEVKLPRSDHRGEQLIGCVLAVIPITALRPHLEPVALDTWKPRSDFTLKA